MITDDPFTPENGHWENNFAVQFTGTGSSKEVDVPAADINYGYGDHIQLKIQMPVMEYLHDDNSSHIEAGNILVGVKARFLDEEQAGIAVSTYPQYQFSNSSLSGADQFLQFFLPLEAAKSFGRFHVAADFGYSFFTAGPDGLAYGMVMGYDLSEPCELLLEFHGDNHFHAGLEEAILNVGMTYKLSTSFVLLASAGRTMYSLEAGGTNLAYVGICWLL